MPDERARNERGRNQRGFTLLEVVIAFAIAALALSVLFHGALDGLRSAGIAGRYEEALARARSHLAALGATLSAADTQGDDGSAYHWHVRVSPIASTVTGGGVIGGVPAVLTTLYAVSVAVSWPEGGSRRVVELDSERLGAAAASGPGMGGP
jgi:general secretion pathway protein I